MPNTSLLQCTECGSVVSEVTTATTCDCGCQQWQEVVCTCLILWPTLGLCVDTIFIRDSTRPCPVHTFSFPLLPPPTTK